MCNTKFPYHFVLMNLFLWCYDNFEVFPLLKSKIAPIIRWDKLMIGNLYIRVKKWIQYYT